MGHRKKGPTLEPVLENYMGPPITFTAQSSVRYKPHKYGTEMKDEAVHITCMNPLSFFGKLRDRYIKAMNEMAMGGDFTAMTGYHGAGAGQEYYTMERCRSVKDREDEALQEELAAFGRSKSQAHRESQVHPSQG